MQCSVGIRIRRRNQSGFEWRRGYEMDAQPVLREDGLVTVTKAKRALLTLSEFLPSYRDLCGNAPYYYAVSEVERLEGEIVRVSSSAEDLFHLTQSIVSQTHGLAQAIRAAKGRGVEPDA